MQAKRKKSCIFMCFVIKNEIFKSFLSGFLAYIIFFLYLCSALKLKDSMDVIIGAGVSGLTYANFTDNEYLVIEQDSHTGGLCNTIYREGFVWDYSGHFFHFQDPRIAQFVSQRIDATKLVTVNKHTQIRYKSRLIDFPFQKNIHQLPRQEFIDCLCDLFDKQLNNQPTFKGMLYDKFGKSIAEKFLIPYNSKLYATDLDNLDADAMGRFFPYADKEDIIRNFRRSENASYNGSFLYHKDGAIAYVRALQSDLDASRIALNERVLSIDPENHQLFTDKRTVNYDHLISTIPFTRLLQLCHMPYNKTALTSNKVLVFNLGFDGKGADVTNHWIYFPEKKYCFYRVGFYSNIIPADRMSLYVEIGFPSDAVVDVEQMLARTLSDLRKAHIVHDEKLIAWHHVIMNPAYVHINKAGIDEVNRCKQELLQHDIYSIGRYGSWNYSSIEDNMKEAMQIAARL